ncbi:MAG: M1 family metallopeptidase, partial [Terriglobia bacterium]
MTDAPSGEPLPFTLEGRSLRVKLGRPYDAGDRLAVRVNYSSRPTVGMYFFPASGKGSAQAWNYGEGGLHYGWLPLYTDTNDRFAVEFTVTVPPPYVAVANGTLRETRENPDGTRTFHWVQEEAIPNYLLTVDVGEFAEVSLPEARVGSRSIPLSVWTPPGTEEAVAWTFRDTPQMVEYFSERFGYPYPWPKYDQITLREFGGAMETTTLVGFTETYQRQEGDPPDSGPAFDLAYPTWAYEDTIAHELAHHWFGDLVTCRSLASIWLNESFATFAHTLWNGHAHGQDDLTYQRWRYRNTYLDFVRKTGTVRPLEYFRYPASEKMYTQEITYVKGSLVLHMLRHFLGDENFFRALKHYLAKNAFGEVESADLQRAFEEATGKNLAWFFDDWVAGGGGRPALEVSASWSRERGALDLRVKQVQADLPFENHFRLPLDIEIITAGGRATHTVWLEGWTTQVSLPAPAEPAAVIIDQGNWLVAELRYERPLREVLYQLAHGDLAARLQAARQLATDFPRRAQAREALTQVLADASAHWGLRLEAAVDLGAMGGRTAVAALMAALDDP